jgi:hypothetical protein
MYVIEALDWLKVGDVTCSQNFLRRNHEKSIEINTIYPPQLHQLCDRYLSFHEQIKLVTHSSERDH